MRRLVGRLAALAAAAAIILPVLVAGIAATSSPAVADQTTGGGDTSGGTVYVIVTVSAGPTTCPISQCGTAPGPGGSSGGSTSGGGPGQAPFVCSYVPDPTLGPPPQGQAPTGEWYVQVCSPRDGVGSYSLIPVWVQYPGGGGPPPPPTPLQVAEQAESEMTLPRPTIFTSPSHLGSMPGTVVNLATWLWIDPSLWHAESVTASAGGVSATATAVPVALSFGTGDGGGLTCFGPGVAYDPKLPAHDQSTDCSYTWRESSAGQPSADGNPNDGTFTLTATVTWAVSWTGSDGTGGTLAPLSTSTAEALRVEQIESIDTSG